MQSFHDALDFCRLKDLGFNGFQFTWSNKRPREQNVWIRLDRGVATIEWILRFPTSRIHHLCKVEFYQPSYWLYSMSNLLVFQQLVIMYLGGNHVRVMSERV